MLEDARLSPHYYLEVSRPGRLDKLTVVAEAKPEAADSGSREAAGRDVAGRIRALVGIGSTVRVGEPGSIERSAGKAKRVFDLRPKD